MTAERRASLVQGARDALIVVGAVLVAFGVGMVYRPAGVIVAGLLLLAGGIRGSR
jgi:hypothetical protein